MTESHTHKTVTSHAVNITRLAEAENLIKTYCLYPDLYYGKDRRPIGVASSFNNVYMLFSDSFAIYGINAESKTELPPVYLKYKPERVICSGEYVIVSFVNRTEIYVAKESDMANGTYVSLPYSCRDAVFFGGRLIAVVNRKLVVMDLATGTLSETEISATAMAADGSNLFVLDNGIISQEEFEAKKKQLLGL